jgi:hypothetical protein
MAVTGSSRLLGTVLAMTIAGWGGTTAQAQGDSTSGTETVAVSFAEESARCRAWYAVQMADASAVVTGRVWWRGRADASLALGFGFTNRALLLDGEFLDNVPFQQRHENPHRPANWGLNYVADGMEFIFEDGTSTTRRIHFVVNFGSGAIRPRIDLLEVDRDGERGIALLPDPAPVGTVARAPIPRTCPGADISLFDGIVPEDGDEPTTRFQIAIPTEVLSTEALAGRPWKVTIRLHDLDSDMTRFKVLEDVVLTPGAEPEPGA